MMLKKKEIIGVLVDNGLPGFACGNVLDNEKSFRAAIEGIVGKGSKKISGCANDYEDDVQF